MGFLKDTDGIARSLKADKDITYRYADSDVATYLPTNVANIGGANLTLTGAVIAGVQNITGPGAVNLTTLLTQITTTGTDAYSLADFYVSSTGRVPCAIFFVYASTKFKHAYMRQWY